MQHVMEAVHITVDQAAEQRRRPEIGGRHNLHVPTPCNLLLPVRTQSIQVTTASPRLQNGDALIPEVPAFQLPDQQSQKTESFAFQELFQTLLIGFPSLGHMPSLVSITMDQMMEDSNRPSLCHLTILRIGGGVEGQEHRNNRGGMTSPMGTGNI